MIAGLRRSLFLPAIALLTAGAGASTAQIAESNAGRPEPPASQPRTPPVSTHVGEPAPSLSISEWLNGDALDLSPGRTKVALLAFAATTGTPSREALRELQSLHERFAAKGVVVAAITDDPPAQVHEYLADQQPKSGIRIGVDRAHATAAAWCDRVAVGFVPYAFLVGPDGRIAWHGHPRQPELAEMIDALLADRYRSEDAIRLIQRQRTPEQLERMFRDACEAEAWAAALAALEELQSADAAPALRLARYRLTILLGEMGDVPAAEALAEQLMQAHAGDVAALNALAWDVVGDSRQFSRSPRLGLRLATAAYRAGGRVDPAACDTYARAVYLCGRLDAAIAIQRRAVERASESQRPAMRRVLDYYLSCRELRIDEP